MKDLMPVERIESKIYLIRGHKVMLDKDLAELYGVKTFVFNQAAKRNKERFPEDFMFQISKEELQNLTSQFVISSWGGRRTLPYVFTEQGIAMLSGILRSKQAVQVNIAIMRAFVRLRKILSTHKELAQKFKELELRVDSLDIEIQQIFEAIKKMIEPEEKPTKRIGFRVGED